MRYYVKNDGILNDINSITSNDIAPKVKKKKRAIYYLFNFFRLIIFIICLAVFVFSIQNIADNFSSYQESQDMYQEIKDNFISINQSTINTMISAPKPVPLKEFADMLIGKGEVDPPVSNDDIHQIINLRNNLDSMKGEIPDIYGWITIPGTNIDYPVVQGTDNQYYVEYDAKKKKNYAGAIFVDYRHKSPPEKTKNMIIYGHNIRTWGTMFNGLVNFLYEDFYNIHDTVKLNTYDGIYEYTVFSVCETDIYTNYTDIYFSDNAEFESFCNDTLSRSLYTRDGIEINKDSKLLTLSTCSNSFNGDKRYVVVCVLTKMTTYNH